jgi:uncharacterized membrane protein
MESHVKILGHAVHQLLIVIPLGLLSGSVCFDVAWLLTKKPEMNLVCYWTVAAGVVGGVVAAPFGSIDWLAIPQGTRAKRVGLFHGIAAATMLAVFSASIWLRTTLDSNDWRVHACLFTGFGLALLVGWTGGELVSRLGIAVYPGAHVDSPSSLSRRPASDNVNDLS